MTTSGYCCFNSSVDCDARRCKNCGWNPAVQEFRVTEWVRKRQESK